MRILVVPSPLLGLAVYTPFAGALDALGHDVRLADVAVDDGDVTTYAGRLAEQATGTEVLVPHSNAGRFAALVAGLVGASVVYVDALLPGVGDQAAFAAFLADLVEDDGRVPPWSQWWPRESLAEIVPPPWLPTLEHAEQRLPLSFLLDEPPAPDDWRRQRAAYLALGDAYLAELTAAREAGWPVRRLPGAGHLHLLVEPEVVAAEVDALADAVVGDGSVDSTA